MDKRLVNVGVAHKVSPNWSQETMIFYSFNCFSIVWGQGAGTIGDFSSEQLLHYSDKRVHLT